MYRLHKPLLLLMVTILTIAVLGFAVQPALAAPNRDGDHPDRKPFCKKPYECYPPCQSKDPPGVHILTGPDKCCYLNEDHERATSSSYYPYSYGHYPRVYGCAGYKYPQPPKRVYYSKGCNCRDQHYRKPSHQCYSQHDCGYYKKSYYKKPSHSYHAQQDGCWVDGRFTTYCRHNSYSASSTNYYYMRNGVWVQDR